MSSQTSAPPSTFSEIVKQSGPGWLQSSVTLGGGSLAGALYLGIIAGPRLLWLQPIAMLLGIVMLSALSHITLSSEERPFRLAIKNVSPFLAWGWLVATIIADIVFCSAQFALGTSAIQQNLGFSNIPSFAITGAFFILAVIVVWQYSNESSSAKFFDNALKCLVGLIVLCFFGVVGVLLFSGSLDVAAIFKGLLPNPASLFNPTPELSEAISQTGSDSDVWRDLLVAGQRDKIITAFGAAVGINMTFLLPYTIRRRGWGKGHRKFARIDLGFGLFIPYFLATSCLVIAAGSQFYASTSAVLDETGAPTPEMAGAYHAQVSTFLSASGKLDSGMPIEAQAAALPKESRELAAMLVNRDAGQVADSLIPLMGKTASQLVFGIGILAMAISTFLIHMIMNGYAVSEAFGAPGKRKIFFFGALLPALTGLFAPLLWMGKPTVKLAIAIPASITATTLLPIAYVTFLLLMNSKKALGEERPKGRSRWIWNCLMILSTLAAGFASLWALSSKGTPGKIGMVAIGLLLIIGIFGFIRRQKSTT